MKRSKLTPIQALPVNLITGFLGVGKTTAIRHLLAHKPADEHWAVLVNEMGEVGIDGALLAQDGIAVKQVAGGCMCCVSGLPSKVALNALIREQRPDRILIEPSGIANPRKILATYTSAEYQGVLDLRATLCLIDPWMLTQPAFLELDTFQEQLALADVLIASKADRASAEELRLFRELAAQLPDKPRVEAIQFGAVDPAWLDLPPRAKNPASAGSPLALIRGHQAQNAEVSEPQSLPADETGVIRRENHSAEAWSCGWIFPRHWIFDQQSLRDLIAELAIPRIKGLVLTDAGWLTLNRMRDYCQWEPATAPADGQTVVEMIAMAPVEWTEVDQRLRGVAHPPSDT